MGNQPKKKVKIRKRTIFTIVSVLNITWYTIVVLIASFLSFTVPSELTVAWFAAWTAELAMLCGIKIKDSSSDSKDLGDEFVESIFQPQNAVDDADFAIQNMYEYEDQQSIENGEENI